MTQSGRGILVFSCRPARSCRSTSQAEARANGGDHVWRTAIAKSWRWPAEDRKSAHREMALPDDPPGELEVIEGLPDGAKIPELEGTPSAFTPDYAPEEMYEVAAKLYKKSR